jgi:hypothetical protein
VPPAEDNALTILTAVEKDAPQTAGLGEAFDALVGAIASGVRAAIARADWPAAETGVKALETSGHAPSLASSLARDLATARTQEEYLATASPASELTLVSFVTAVLSVRCAISADRGLGRGRVRGRSRRTDTRPQGAASDADGPLRAIRARGRCQVPVRAVHARRPSLYERRVYLRLRYGLK